MHKFHYTHWLNGQECTGHTMYDSCCIWNRLNRVAALRCFDVTMRAMSRHIFIFWPPSTAYLAIYWWTKVIQQSVSPLISIQNASPVSPNKSAVWFISSIDCDKIQIPWTSLWCDSLRQSLAVNDNVGFISILIRSHLAVRPAIFIFIIFIFIFRYHLAVRPANFS